MLCIGKRRGRIATKIPKPEEVVTKLRQIEILVGQGMAGFMRSARFA